MSRITLLLTTCLCPLALAPAEAANFSSGATATTTHIAASGTVAADATVAPVSGTAAPAYDRTGGVANINQNFTLTNGATGMATQGLQTGAVTTEALSNGTSSATGTVSLANVQDALASKLVGDVSLANVLGLTADAIGSTTTAGIDSSGNLFANGSSSLTNLGLNGSALTTAIDGSLYANPAANTVILSLAGLTVTLNEQLRTQTSSSISLQTNAVHIALNNYSLAGKLLTGDVILGHSEASVTGAVPEPGTWATMLMGFGVIGFALRRRRPGVALA